MNDITPKEASEILSHYTNLGYGIVIEGDDVSKIKQALSLASKTLANGTSITEGDLIMFRTLMTEIANKGLPFEEVLLLIDNAQAIPLPNEQIAWEQGYEAGLAQGKVEITEEQAINKLHETGWLIGHDKEMTTRPQGEWYYGEDECGQDGWFCSECNFFVPWYYQYYEKDINFIRDYKACPHCLAEMVTYTGKDRDTKGGVE